METISKEEWRQAKLYVKLMANPERFFVLYILNDESCHRISDFRRHFGSRPTKEDFRWLQQLGVIMISKRGGKLRLTEDGKWAIGVFLEDKPHLDKPLPSTPRMDH